ncbi:sodium-dependent transporter [Sporohalobacter salinus]|uniref:sodium-dependent transporter n=1 Tax=Sporohalobacter salinus TaxID=1494606 RepID=UPI00196211EB|nr:sodium-dependent transporter [Sporohalobacter salinus]MBM7623919.1 NSS family neurotransmitter:Na+ symporter [Sporohalobacter salinus]
MSSDLNNDKSTSTERETFSGKFGFIISCVGSAMGLANIWMFPWRVGKFGGVAFLIPYLIFLFGLSTLGLMGEFSLGRSQRRGPIGSFNGVFEEKNKENGDKLGVIPVIGVTGVFIFYVIVMGWILKYLSLAITGSFDTINIANYFGNFISTPESIFWHALGVFITILIVRSGIENGIERANKYMMSLFYMIIVTVLIRSLTLTGAEKGIEFLLIPDWSYLTNIKTWIMALGMSFFTLCLGGAGMVIYGSYLKQNEDIPLSATLTSVFNLSASLLAAFTIIPAAFAFGLDPAAGPTLLFKTVPHIFLKMPGGYIFGLLFFICVTFAAISSAINMIEVPVGALIDRLNWSREKSVWSIGLVSFLIGIPLNLNMLWFNKFSNLFAILVLPSGAVLAAIVYYWVYDVSEARKEINQGSNYPLGKWLEPYMKYIFTIVSFIVLVAGYLLGGF